MMKSVRESVNNTKTGVLIAYFLIYVVWGSTYYFIGVALKGFPVFLLGALRFSAAGLILLVVCYLKREPVFSRNLIRRSAVSGIVLLFVDMAVIMLAQRYVSSSFVAIMASSTAIWILFFDFPMWKENFRNPRIVTGIVVGFLGVLLLYWEQITSDALAPYSLYGFWLLVFGCISWALGTLYVKYRSPAEEKTNAFAGSAWQMLFASTMFWIVAMVNDDVSGVQWQTIPAEALYSLLYLILFGSILAYSAYIWLLKVRPAVEVATHAYVNPFVAILLGTTLGNETVTWIQIAGLVIILLSVLLVSNYRRKKLENERLKN